MSPSPMQLVSCEKRRLGHRHAHREKSMWRQRKKTRREASEETNAADTLILEF